MCILKQCEPYKNHNLSFYSTVLEFTNSHVANQISRYKVFLSLYNIPCISQAESVLSPQTPGSTDLISASHFAFSKPEKRITALFGLYSFIQQDDFEFHPCCCILPVVCSLITLEYHPNTYMYYTVAIVSGCWCQKLF